MRNVELLKKTAEWVQREEGHHYEQGTWGTAIVDDLVPAGVEEWNTEGWWNDETEEWVSFYQMGEAVPPCKTTGCVAGNAMLASGLYEMRRDASGFGYSFYRKGDSQRVIAPSTAAAELLGLDYNEANVLFDQDWKPANGNVAKTLLLIADGAEIEHVTDWSDADEDEGEEW